MTVSQKVIDVLNNSEESRAILKTFNDRLVTEGETRPEIIDKMREQAVMIALLRNEEAQEVFARELYHDIRNGA